MKRILPMTLATSLLLSGCFWEKEEPAAPPPPPTDFEMSISEIKERYNDTADKDIMPLYNVAHNKEFKFFFQSYLGDLPVSDVITVHTDSKATPDSIIPADIQPESFVVGPSTLEVKPAESVLTPSKNANSWGNASHYYIKVYYDMDATTPTKLEEPIVIPFTIKAPTAPEIALGVDERGEASIKWKKVEGATQYKIYNLSKPIIQGVKVDDLDAAETGFEGVFPFHIATVDAKTLQFNDWYGDGRKPVTAKTEIGAIQNDGINGDYYVTAVINKKESLASNLVDVASLANKMPTTLVEDINGEVHETVRSLPKSVKVNLMTGDVADMAIIYQTDKVKLVDKKPTVVPYTIQNTAYKGVITIDNLTEADLAVITAGNPVNATSDFKPVFNHTALLPSADVPTLIISEPVIEEPVVEEPVEGETKTGEVKEEQPAKEGEVPAKEDEAKPEEEKAEEGDKQEAQPKEEEKSVEGEVKEEQPKEGEPAEAVEETPVEEPVDEIAALEPQGIVAQQKKNTEQTVAQANTATVTVPALFEVENAFINADSAFEEYLALSLLDGRSEISLKAFPEVQNYDELEDLVQKVIYQNPLILGVTSYKYDYKTVSLTVAYANSPEKQKAQQKEMLVEANRIIKEVAPKDMADVDKRKVLYDYLADNATYGLGIVEEPVLEEEVTETEPVEAEKPVEGEAPVEEKPDANALNGVTPAKEGEEAPKEAKEGEEVPKEDEGVEETPPVEPEEDFDAFTAYGVLVEKQGTDIAFAQAYHLLLDLAALDSVTVTGVYEGKTHVWNKVNVDGQWLNTDVANNETNTGIPYMLYEASDKTAFKTNMIENDAYWTNQDISLIRSDNDGYDYYVKNNLVVDSVEDYTAVISEKLQAGETKIILRTDVKLDAQAIYDATGLALQQYAADKLSTSQFGSYGNFLIVLTELPEEEVEEELPEEGVAPDAEAPATETPKEEAPSEDTKE